jgi:phenylpropionate dioxygenase-like ring-hydroxylating dioxygenase large terminal subunit
METNIPLLRDFWYVAAPAGALKPGGMLPVTLLGEQILLLRDKAGNVSALRDFCPHRGMPLRYGTFNGHEVQCCYHGWCFSTQGTCTKIPSLVEEKTDISKIKTGTYPAQEKQGLVWVYVGDAKEIPPLPVLPVDGDCLHVDSVHFPCDIDHAVIGLMDPSHGPFVHQSWWWRSGKSIHAKEKKFAPRHRGFCMVSHAPSSNSRAYRILGGAGQRSTEIEFQLPSLRSEHITIGKKYVYLLTALTPVDETNTVLHQFIATNITLARWLLPLLKPFGKAFIQQDLNVVKMQQEGLRQPNQPSLMLLGDADAQALWYYRLKKEWLAARDDARPFENPLKERVLRWRS